MREFQVDGDVIAEVVAYLNGHKTVPAQRMADAVLRLLNRHYQDAAALEAARADAERYRHLRSNESSGAVDLCICRVEWSHKLGNGRARFEVIAEDRADAAIDAAMAQGA